MKNLRKWAFLALTTTALISCNNDDDSMGNENEGTHVSAVLKFEHSLGLGDEFTLTDSEDNQQNLELTKFKFIVSDVKVTTTNDEVVALSNNDAAELIDLANADETDVVRMYLTGIPEGSYKSISFGVGVSQEVASGSTENQIKLMELAEQDSEDMVWSWNPNSYIFSKIEATNLDVTTTAPTNLQIHVGNKGGVDGFRTVELIFPETLTIASKISPSIHTNVSIEKLFTPDAPGIEVAYDAIGAHGGTDDASINFSDNYANIFEIEHLHPNEAAINLEDVEMDNHAHDDEDSEDSHSH
ncbi:hypothetical protein FHR24_002028 [Wenyingzhuangia heitensis]|uniref:Copper-binding protein MbnP-like domain-containing protein n=1 Tax=Wenyingzhuangia heitensis TaxID=1487859 RepID=A0ABX0UCE6_9FLAO|nr:MbnP family protein [Wenyingzhuangia heitensis]NIJ45560.1 hypothetical protein [Wenyingzhuangia heitensis]